MSDDKLLKQFSDLVDLLNETPGTNAKIEILQRHDELRPLIRRIWDDTKTHVTKRGLETWREKKNFAGVKQQNGQSLYELYDALASGELSGDAAKIALWQYIANYPKYEDLILRIVEKNPRIRLGAAMLLKAFPGIFSQFKVCLSKEWTEEDFEKAYAANKRAWISDKIDGIRLVTKILPNRVEFYTRKGNVVTSLEILRRDIMEHIVPEMTDAEIAEGQVLDGEVVALDKSGREDFKLTVSEARKKDVTMANPRYKIFDMLPISVFEERAKGDKFGLRLEKLRDVMQDAKPKQCELLPQTVYTAKAFEQMKERARKLNMEGVMIRFDALYEAKRTRNLLKWKIMCQEEYTVKDVIIEDMPFPNKTGGEDTCKAVSAVVIHHKGNPVHVGSGFDKAERLEFATHKNRILGKTITVKFQEEFKDAKTGNYSLRCPIYMGIVGDKEREV